MKSYIFYFIDAKGDVSSFDIADCRDDDEAWRRAPALMRLRNHIVRVEIFEGARRLEAPASAPRLPLFATPNLANAP